MSNETYRKAQQRLYEARQRAERGDKAACGDKVSLAVEVRAMEREAAREGRLLSATAQPDGKVAVSEKRVPPKRDLQREYCRKFDNERVVKVGNEETTLRDYHKKRLGV